MSQFILKFQNPLFLLGSGFLLGTFGILVRYMDVAFGPMTQTALRFAIATVMIWGFMCIRKIPFRLKSQNKQALFIFMILAPLVPVFFTLAVLEIKVTNTLFLLYGASLGTTLIMGRLVLKEPFTKNRLFAFMCFMIGLVLIAKPDTALILTAGILFALLSGLFDGLGHFSRRVLGSDDVWTLLFWQSVCATLMGLALALGFDSVFFKTHDLAAYIATGMFCIFMILAGLFMSYGFNNFDLNFGTIILSSELGFALLLSAAFLNEWPTPAELLGGIFIFMAIILTQFKHTVSLPSFSWLRRR